MLPPAKPKFRTSAPPKWVTKKSINTTMINLHLTHRSEQDSRELVEKTRQGTSPLGSCHSRNLMAATIIDALRRFLPAHLREHRHAMSEAQRRAVWQKDWGVHLQPFGSGENIIKYLGAYVCRTAIGDSRILSVSDTHVSIRWKDHAHGDAQRVETLEGKEFVKRYLRHVLPRGMRAVRYFGFCHPAVKIKRECIAFHTGRSLLIGAVPIPPVKPPHVVVCSYCGEPMRKIRQLRPAWRGGPGMTPPSRSSRAPPPQKRSSA